MKLYQLLTYLDFSRLFSTAIPNYSTVETGQT